MSKESNNNQDKRRGIQSVETGVRVLEALASIGEPATLKRVAEQCGMAPSQTHRYLVSLIESGMAHQNEATGRYDLGAGAIKIGLAALGQADPIREADSEISQFVARTGRTVQIAALGPQGPTVIRWHMGRPAVMTSFSVGSVLPLLYSATGHVFLTFAPEQELIGVLYHELADAQMDHSQVEAIRERVRKDGCSLVHGTMIPGLRATAFPIFDLQGRAVLTATSLQPDSSVYKKDEEGEELRAACKRVSERLGWVN
ncbi:IclR family transcriptional regulator [Hirschia baltica]|uniref:Transcriptional regulator, IclR family n=1 Tax=Hirschia baltica (strain ATCC 49814 / DSM 5838 / IFAM 1418) TaxID=582402 RepID=C6XPQ1_HIRBI|nr:IclR family transcriptional regulator [Hirschia baltica]ACT60316.1 transcriptional regulator, IclR family [Hirschia baltica ATCC 49814]